MKESEWADLNGWMAELWPHAPLAPETVKAWWPFVADLDYDRARQAVAALALEPGRRFPPSAGDILHVANVNVPGWFDAWLEVVEACEGDHGRIGTSRDPVVARFLRQLGPWRERIDETSSTLRAQFRDYWRDAVQAYDLERRRSLADRAAIYGATQHALEGERT